MPWHLAIGDWQPTVPQLASAMPQAVRPRVRLRPEAAADDQPAAKRRCNPANQAPIVKSQVSASVHAQRCPVQCVALIWCEPYTQLPVVLARRCCWHLAEKQVQLSSRCTVDASGVQLEVLTPPAALLLLLSYAIYSVWRDMVCKVKPDCVRLRL